MPDDMEQIQEYRELVERYEVIGEQIQALIRKNGGHSENMSGADMQTYRQLASERDELYDRMKTIEANLLNEENNS
ncbi:MAG TPA: hypothetical protein VJZ27_03760 [Aggregatilineales bacterium]|nr:hypothetical protein [Aggregatilineales bacterium]